MNLSLRVDTKTNLSLWTTNLTTLGKVSVFGAFFWCNFFPHLDWISIGTYRVNPHIHSECGVIRVRSTWRHETSSFNSRCFPLLILEYNHSISIYWALFSEEVYYNFIIIFLLYIYIIHIYICIYIHMHIYIYTYIYIYNINTYM